MLNMILNSIIPVFFVMALGYLAGWTRDIDNHHVAELNALVMDFALPASLLVAMMQTPRTLLVEEGGLMLVVALSMWAIYGVAFLLQRRVFKLDTRQAAIGSLTAASPNLAAVGSPLISSIFGAPQTVSVSVAITVGAITLTPLTLVLLETGGGTAKDVPGLRHIVRSIGTSLRKPIVLAPIIGMLLALAGVHLPHILASSLGLIGVASGGVAAFLTGLILSSQPFQLKGNVVSGMLLKNVVHPLFAAALVAALVVSPLIGREAIILCAAPSGFFGILFGLRYGVVSQDVGSTVIASSILSAATIPAAILLTAGTH